MANPFKIAAYDEDLSQPFKDGEETAKVEPEVKPQEFQGRITGISIPFLDLVVLMVKAAFAAIPAAIIIYLVWAFLGTAFLGVVQM